MIRSRPESYNMVCPPRAVTRQGGFNVHHSKSLLWQDKEPRSIHSPDSIQWSCFWKLHLWWWGGMAYRALWRSGEKKVLHVGLESLYIFPHDTRVTMMITQTLNSSHHSSIFLVVQKNERLNYKVLVFTGWYVSAMPWSLTLLLGCPYEHHFLLNLYLVAARNWPVQTNRCPAFGKYLSFMLFFVKSSLYQCDLKLMTTDQWTHNQKSSINIMSNEELWLSL